MYCSFIFCFKQKTAYEMRISDWISDVCSSDLPVVLRKNWLSAYDFVAASGAQALNDHARSNDPFAEVGKIQVAVDVSSVIRASKDSFRIAWTERRYQDGSLVATSRWSAIATVKQVDRKSTRLNSSH